MCLVDCVLWFPSLYCKQSPTQLSLGSPYPLSSVVTMIPECTELVSTGVHNRLKRLLIWLADFHSLGHGLYCEKNNIRVRFAHHSLITQVTSGIAIGCSSTNLMIRAYVSSCRWLHHFLKKLSFYSNRWLIWKNSRVVLGSLLAVAIGHWAMLILGKIYLGSQVKPLDCLYFSQEWLY